MARTHLSFKNFRPAAVDAAERLFAEKPWSITDELRLQEIAQEFSTRVCAAYSAPQAVVIVVDDPFTPTAYTPAIVREDGLGRMESVQQPTIRLGKWSIVNLFTVMRTHLLANGAEQKAHDPNGWAHSLFYTVKPAMFRKAVRSGRIRGLTAKDTFTSATWAKLVEHGVGDPYDGSLMCDPSDVNDILARIDAGTYVDDVDVDEEDTSQSERADDFEFTDDLDDEDEFDVDPDDFTDEGERMELEFGHLEGDHPELDPARFEDTSDVGGAQGEVDLLATSPRPSEIAMEAVEASEADDGLDALGIVALRKKSRGIISGGYSMGKPDLIVALRNAGVRA